jgi:subtilisin family serine protease
MRRAALPTLILLALAASPASAAVPTTGRVVVVLEKRDGTRARGAALSAVADRARARTAQTVQRLGVAALVPPRGESARSLAADVRRDPDVREARPELRFRPRYLPNDPALSATETAAGTPPGTAVQWAAARENLPRLWDVTRGETALVGVIDTGLDASHPELKGKVFRAADQGGGSPADSDLAGHGTHVASMACANTDNGIGLAGAGFDCKLVLERTNFFEVSIADSIVDAVDSGAQAINMSFGDEGGVQSAAMRSAIDYGVDRGVVFVAAAADTPITEQGQPANLLQPTSTGPDLDAGKGLTVTSADFSGKRSSFAGLGSQISLAAYGSFGSGGPPGLFAAFPGNPTTIETADKCTICRTTFAGDNRYAYLQGTSMAAPQVAAIAALIKNLNPDIPLTELLRILKETASNASWEPELGWGVIDAGAAVDVARRIDRTPPVSEVSAPRHATKTRFKVRWSGTDPALPGLEPSGIRYYEVYAKPSGGAYKRIARTKRTSVRFKARRGKLYRFYSLATDKAGNRERPPSGSDARTRVAKAR